MRALSPLHRLVGVAVVVGVIAMAGHAIPIAQAGSGNGNGNGNIGNNNGNGNTGNGQGNCQVGNDHGNGNADNAPSDTSDDRAGGRTSPGAATAYGAGCFPAWDVAHLPSGVCVPLPATAPAAQLACPGWPAPAAPANQPRYVSGSG